MFRRWVHPCFRHRGSRDPPPPTHSAQSGELVRAVEAHADAVNDIQLARDRMTFITASKDQTSCLFDTQTLEKLKTYKADRPLNSACIAPERDHVVIGGGQDASMVTTTAGRSGRFESLLYHKIFETQLGSIKGHFGPINALAFNPNGKSFTTGGEDGYIRIHHLDPDYFRLEA
mmetsp:Transcript_39648/g.85839  ORF Transcript_39648/g.85839 Transcript_39648/m.85839 type:complete len:174 (-) Transcript_39648:44-565(-)